MAGGGICAAVSEEIALGLSLAGITDIFIHNNGEGEGELKRWYAQRLEERVGVMILSKECGEVLTRELFERRVTGEMLPVTVIIPSGVVKRTNEKWFPGPKNIF